MRQILRCGAYELIARPDVRTGTIISEYVDVAKAFYEEREAGFVNGLLDGLAKAVADSGQHPGLTAPQGGNNAGRCTNYRPWAWGPNHDDATARDQRPAAETGEEDK